jgi:hypothetical protein
MTEHDHPSELRSLSNFEARDPPMLESRSGTLSLTTNGLPGEEARLLDSSGMRRLWGVAGADAGADASL